MSQAWDHGKLHVHNTEQGKIVSKQILSHLEYKMAWTAYVMIAPRFVFRTAILLLIWQFVNWAMKYKPDHFWMKIAFVAIIVYSTTKAVYEVIVQKKTSLIIDRQGVWLCQGVWAWNRGVAGARWEEIGDAGYRQGFVSWASKSYTILVNHRYSNRIVLQVVNLARGNEAVEDINQMLRVSKQQG
jgi:hypothetical protein